MLAIGGCLGLTCLTYKEPILALMLKQEKNLSVIQIGLVFTIDTITFSLTSFALNFIKEDSAGKKYGLIQFAGLVILGIGI